MLFVRGDGVILVSSRSYTLLGSFHDAFAFPGFASLENIDERCIYPKLPKSQTRGQVRAIGSIDVECYPTIPNPEVLELTCQNTIPTRARPSFSCLYSRSSHLLLSMEIG